MSMRAFCVFLDYKCLPKGQIFSHRGENLYDVNNQPVLAVGGWRSLSNLMKYKVTVQWLHKVVYARSCSGPYKATCAECVKKNMDLGPELENIGRALGTTLDDNEDNDVKAPEDKQDIYDGLDDVINQLRMKIGF